MFPILLVGFCLLAFLLFTWVKRRPDRQAHKAAKMVRKNRVAREEKQHTAQETQSRQKELLEVTVGAAVNYGDRLYEVTATTDFVSKYRRLRHRLTLKGSEGELYWLDIQTGGTEYILEFIELKTWKGPRDDSKPGLKYKGTPYERAETYTIPFGEPAGAVADASHYVGEVQSVTYRARVNQATFMYTSPSFLRFEKLGNDDWVFGVGTQIKALDVRTHYQQQ